MVKKSSAGKIARKATRYPVIKATRNPVTKAKAHQWYTTNVPTYRALAVVVEKTIKEVLEAHGVTYALVSSRVKELDSLVGKVAAKEYTNLGREMTDFAGARIILLREEDVSK